MTKTAEAVQTAIPVEGAAPDKVLPASRASFKSNPDALFQRIRQKKGKMAAEKEYIKEAIKEEPDYEEANAALKETKLNMEHIKKRVEDRNKVVMDTIDEMRKDIKEDVEMLDDILYAKMAAAMEKGETIQLSLFDEFSNQHLAHPTFKIKPVPKKKGRRYGRYA